MCILLHILFKRIGTLQAKVIGFALFDYATVNPSFFSISYKKVENASNYFLTPYSYSTVLNIPLVNNYDNELNMCRLLFLLKRSHIIEKLITDLI